MTDELVERVARALAGYIAENGYSDEDWACAPDQVRWRDQARTAVAATGMEELEALLEAECTRSEEQMMRTDRAERRADRAEAALRVLRDGPYSEWVVFLARVALGPPVRKGTDDCA